MEHSIRTLSEQIKLLSLNMPVGAPVPHVHQTRSPGSPAASAGTAHSQLPAHLRQHPSYSPQGTYAAPATQAQGWYPTPSLPSTQGTPSGPSQGVGLPPSTSKTEDWEEIFMSVLGGQDMRQLRELLARSNPEVILPSSGKGPLSQAVVLTLIHRVSLSYFVDPFPNSATAC